MQPQAFDYGAPPKRPLSKLAVLSLVTAFVCQPVGFILGIVALVGISRAQGRLGGTGLAIAGIVLSILTVPCVGMTAAIAIPALLVSRFSVNESMAKATLKSIHSAEQISLAESGACYGLAELPGKHLIGGEFGAADSRGVVVKSGYAFTVFVRGTRSFVAYAWPEKGSRSSSMFAITENGAIMVRTPSPFIGPGDVPPVDEIEKAGWKAEQTYTRSSSWDD